jgi:hypothetical protein
MARIRPRPILKELYGKPSSLWLQWLIYSSPELAKPLVMSRNNAIIVGCFTSRYAGGCLPNMIILKLKDFCAFPELHDR